MKISLVDEMRNIDEKSINTYGVPELLPMENAARVTATAMENLIGDLNGKNICILAGSGNNGGDALASARHLLNRGAKVKIFLVGNLAHLTKSTAIQRDIALKMDLEVQTVDGERAIDRLQVVLKRFTDGIVDGILGTGFFGELRENTKKIILAVNAAAKPTVSIDVPSGVEADTGKADCAVFADVTVALGLPKIGHFLAPGARHAGKVLVDGIGLPAQLLCADTIKQTLIDHDSAKTMLPGRDFAAHKGMCGRVLVVAGSRGMTGAACLAAQAALKVGAGIVTLAIAESLHGIMEAKLTEIMTRPLPETENGIIGGDRAMGSILELADAHDTILVGPGLGRHRDTMELLRNALPNIDKQIVIDADGIFAFKKHRELLKNFKRPPILTPHLGEMATFLDTTVDEIRASLVATARETAKQYRATFVVKSECTIVAFPDGEIFFASTGNAGMATAGCGDVLAGTIAGLAKEAKEPFAPVLGVHIHGTAGDAAFAEKGEGLIASDILDNLPAARKKIRET